MPYCVKCGKELGTDVKFCPKCGAAVSPEGRVSTRAVSPDVRTREACLGPPGSGGGLWGAISFGVFIIDLAILIIFGWFWPGILFLIALMIIIGALVAYSRRWTSPASHAQIAFKPKVP